MIYGAAYYPEHWPAERWPVDAKLMREAGMNVVRLAEFAWCRLEPEPGRFEFGWLDEAIRVLSGEGLQVVLCTPTPTPPAWLIAQHPDVLPCDENRLVKSFGVRHHRCVNSQPYREHSAQIIRAMAEHFAANEAVIGWQTDNEFGCHDSTRCYCDRCAAAFRAWLERRYGTLEALNVAWGTIFWSQEYTAWSQIPLPWRTTTHQFGHNPSLLLDFYRFSSDAQVDYQRGQIELLRAANPHWFVTHNLMGLFRDIHYFDLAADLDFVSWDNYPFGTGEDYFRAALAHDVMRGLKERNFWVMEQASGPGGWNTFAPTPRPGQMRLWAYQSIAHGADAIVFFRWRTCRFGTEQYWHGLLLHDGEPRRRYREAQQLGRELQQLGPLLEGSTPQPEVALVNDYDQIWALTFQPHTPEGLDYQQVMGLYYRALKRLGIDVAVVGLETDFTRYRLVILPPLYLAEPALAERLEAYVRSGGTVVFSPRSGVKDRHNVVVDARLPGVFRHLTGIRIDEYDTGVSPDNRFLMAETGREYQMRQLAEVIEPDGATAWATYTADYYAGQPAATVNEFGAGRAYYLGTFLEDQFYLDFFAELGHQLNLRRVRGLPRGVEAAARTKGGETFTFLLNYAAEPRTVPLSGTFQDVLTDETVKARITLEASGVAVLRGDQV